MSNIEIPEVNPPTGTNWTCQVVQDLKQIVREMRFMRKRILYWANFVSTMGMILGAAAFILAVVNVWLRLTIINVLLALITGLLLFLNLDNVAIQSYDTAFELQDIIDSVLAELRLPVCQRIDAIFYMRMIQMDRDATLSDWTLTTVFS